MGDFTRLWCYHSYGRALPPVDDYLPPRVTLLDGEDLRMVTEAEPSWLNGVINKLRYQGRSTEYDDFAEAAKSFLREP